MNIQVGSNPRKGVLPAQTSKDGKSFWVLIKRACDCLFSCAQSKVPCLFTFALYLYSWSCFAKFEIANFCESFRTVTQRYRLLSLDAYTLNFWVGLVGTLLFVAVSAITEDMRFSSQPEDIVFVGKLGEKYPDGKMFLMCFGGDYGRSWVFFVSSGWCQIMFLLFCLSVSLSPCCVLCGLCSNSFRYIT